MELIQTRALNTRQQEARLLVLDVAAELMRAADHTEQITMTVIAERAGLSRATLFRLFTSRDQLLTEAAGVTIVIVTPDPATGQFAAQAWQNPDDARRGLEGDGMALATTITGAYNEAVIRCMRSTKA